VSREITRVTTAYGVVDDPLEREGEIRERLRDLEADPEVTERSNGAERDRLIGEYTEIRRATRAAQIDRGMRAMADEANLERPNGAVGAPALVRGLGDGRRESAAEIIARSGNPWAARSGSLDGHTSYGRTDPAPG
jgi:hypothetical protein